ncbi:MAG: CarD family transcriptional regulator [Eubacterium sp.]|nr:CarD family transcriptional regulator [Eubacterium sp.]
MFKVGDYIVHGRNGVCQVKDITHIDLSGADKDQLYYTLIPVHSENRKIFYPVDSDKVVMRSVISREEAESIVKDMDQIKPMWIENEKSRELRYKEAIGSADCQKLIGVIKALYERNHERMAQGKRITFVDDRYLKEAKKNLFDEFAIALDIREDEVEDYIKSHK